MIHEAAKEKRKGDVVSSLANKGMPQYQMDSEVIITL